MTAREKMEARERRELEKRRTQLNKKPLKFALLFAALAILLAAGIDAISTQISGQFQSSIVTEFFVEPYNLSYNEEIAVLHTAVLVCGTSSGLFSKPSANKEQVGMSAVTVPGATGETTADYISEPWNLANIVLADGPAGLRK